MSGETLKANSAHYAGCLLPMIHAFFTSAERMAFH